jgi:hypothetical protein
MLVAPARLPRKGFERGHLQVVQHTARAAAQSGRFSSPIDRADPDGGRMCGDALCQMRFGTAPAPGRRTRISHLHGRYAHNNGA